MLLSRGIVYESHLIIGSTLDSETYDDENPQHHIASVPTLIGLMRLYFKDWSLLISTFHEHYDKIFSVPAFSWNGVDVQLNFLQL